MFSFVRILETQQGIFDAVLKGYIDFESEPWPLISDSAKDLIRKMLCSRPSERLTAHEVLCMSNISQSHAFALLMVEFFWFNCFVRTYFMKLEVIFPSKCIQASYLLKLLFSFFHA